MVSILFLALVGEVAAVATGKGVICKIEHADTFITFRAREPVPLTTEVAGCCCEIDVVFKVFSDASLFKKVSHCHCLLFIGDGSYQIDTARCPVAQ